MDRQDVVAALQTLQSMTGRSDLTQPVMEELLDKYTKLNAAEAKLATWAARSIWKILWKRIKARWPRLWPAIKDSLPSINRNAN